MRGLELSRRFYDEAVRPILERRFPRLEHAGALIGPGSEVLGYDDDVSTDHHWGPRVQLFVGDLAGTQEVVDALARELPEEFGGWPTSFGEPDEHGVQHLEPVEPGEPVTHRVELFTVPGFMRETIGFDPGAGIGVADWLTTPTHRLLSVTAGAVFADPIGELRRARDELAWYPDDVWLYAMAGRWRRLAALEHLMGRAGSTGDELGSRLIAASLVRELMLLAFLQERRYAPYPKWLGRAYAEFGREERPALEAVLAAGSWQVREQALTRAYRAVAEAHNRLALTEHVDPVPRPFHDRPFLVLDADRFADVLRAAIADPAVLAVGHDAGAIDAVTDSTHVLTRPALWQLLAALYRDSS